MTENYILHIPMRYFYVIPIYLYLFLKIDFEIIFSGAFASKKYLDYPSTTAKTHVTLNRKISLA